MVKASDLSHELNRFIPAFSGFSTCLVPLHPVPALDPLTVEFALDVRSDPQFSGVPEAIHFSGEVFGELGRVNYQQCFIVGVGGRG